MRTLAYNLPVMTRDLAKELARRFLACCGEGAVFVTNGSLAQSTKGGQWEPLTGATFDTGIVAVSSRRVRISFARALRSLGEFCEFPDQLYD